MLPRILLRVVDGMRRHRQFAMKSENHGYSTWVFIGTWKVTELVRVTVTIIDRKCADPSSELTNLGEILCAIGTGVSLVSLSGALTP